MTERQRKVLMTHRCSDKDQLLCANGYASVFEPTARVPGAMPVRSVGMVKLQDGAIFPGYLKFARGLRFSSVERMGEVCRHGFMPTLREGMAPRQFLQPQGGCPGFEM
jgi:hypothetical protein